MSKYSERERDVPRMLWTKARPCQAFLGPWPAALIWPCEGVIEADHAGGGSGMGRKCDDSLLVSLCVRHHRAPGLEHLVYGHVQHGTVRQWKREQADRNRAQYDKEQAGG